MILFGIVDLSHPIVQAALALLVVGFFTVIALVKFYSYITCGYFHERVRMDGKTVIITGANGGIGFETAKEIAKRGARVIMACRNMETGNKARDEIVESTKNENVIVKQLNLASQKSIRAFAEDIIRTEPRLDVLIHNAGTAEKSFQQTEDGIELTMATNHFGPYLLTHLLIAFFKTPRQGCQTSVFLACSEEITGVSGKYFMDCAEKGLSSGAMDESKAKKLWELSEQFVNLKTIDTKI